VFILADEKLREEESAVRATIDSWHGDYNPDGTKAGQEWREELRHVEGQRALLVAIFNALKRGATYEDLQNIEAMAAKAAKQ